MRIFLIGTGQPYEVNTFIYKGIQELGYPNIAINLNKFYPAGENKLERLYIKVFNKFMASILLNDYILRTARQFRPDFIIVVKGSKISYQTLGTLKQEFGCALVNYATDDPFNPLIFSQEIVDCIPLFDFYFCTKHRIIDDVRRAGGNEVLFLPFAYQSDYHYPEKPIDLNEQKKYASDVAFIGGADDDRYAIVSALTSISSIDIKLFGAYWEKYPELRKHHYGFVYGKEYRLALSASKVALGFVRHSNRDGHSPRSYEIPACGAFLLAENTTDHRELFIDGREAVLFSSIDELVEKISFYLVNEISREKIAHAGYEKITKKGKNTYRDRVEQIIATVRK